jgi:hypothetical protein
LWTDRTTGLAHCYESDKAQPGRQWYGRSLAFHDWVARALQSTPRDLGADIDWLFTRGTEKLAAIVLRKQAKRASLAAEQRAPYAGQGFPEPGEDAGMEAIVEEVLSNWLTDPPPDAMRQLAQRLRTYLAQENKRKNLVGEGFEDVLARLMSQLPGASKLDIRVRPLLHDVPGFRPPPRGQKPRRVDLAIIKPRMKRILITAKWSVRADREEQFGVDGEAYARLEDHGKGFEFVLITNEFDAARLVAACERRQPPTALFKSVVHVNPQGILAAYGSELKHSAERLGEHIESGRLMSLDRWLSGLSR